MPGRFLALVLLCACLAAVPAMAQDTGFYASAGGSYYAIQLPDYSPMALSTGVVEYRDTRTVHDGFADGPMAGMTLGWKTEEGVFFEARGFFANPESRQDHLLPTPAGAADIGMLGLNGVASVIMGPGITMATSTKLSVEQYGGELLAGYEIPLCQDLSVSPFVGYSFMELDQDRSLLAYPSIAPIVAFNRSEKLDSTSHGLEAGLRLDYSGESVRARLAGTLGWANVHTEYHGQDWGMLTGSMGLQRDDWGGRARLEGGLDLPLGDWTLGLDAGVEYLSFVPGIQSSAPLVPTSLTSEDSVSGRVGLSVGYAF